MDLIPILKIGDILLVSIQIEIHDRLILTLQDELTTKIVETGARGVLIDISAVELVDSFIGRVIADIAAMARILDAETILVGMRPEVAMTVVELGMSLSGVRTSLNIDRGIAALNALFAASGRHDANDS